MPEAIQLIYSKKPPVSVKLYQVTNIFSIEFPFIEKPIGFKWTLDKNFRITESIALWVFEQILPMFTDHESFLFKLSMDTLPEDLHHRITQLGKVK